MCLFVGTSTTTDQQKKQGFVVNRREDDDDTWFYSQERISLHLLVQSGYERKGEKRRRGGRHEARRVHRICVMGDGPYQS